MKKTITKIAGTGAVLVATMLVPTSVVAATSGSSDYGNHVVLCAQMTGFDGTHNPGMHRGFGMWDPDHECMGTSLGSHHSWTFGPVVPSPDVAP